MIQIFALILAMAFMALIAYFAYKTDKIASSK
jgi:hypothetical protein